MIIDFNALPRWFLVVVQVLFALWVLATVLAAAFRRIPAARYDAWDRAAPAFGHFARLCRKFGTDVEPAVREFVAFLASVVTFRNGPRSPGGGSGPPYREPPPPPRVEGSQRRVSTLDGGWLGFWRALGTTLLAGTLGVTLGVVMVGCRPLLGPEDGCEPRRYACREGRPYVCSDTHRWAPTMPACPAGEVCTEGVSGSVYQNVATCLPVAQDGGAR